MEIRMHLFSSMHMYILSIFLCSQTRKTIPLRSIGSISQAPTLEPIQEEQERELQQMRAKVRIQYMSIQCTRKRFEPCWTYQAFRWTFE